MKIRIQDNTIRVRLSMAELDQLCDGYDVEMTTRFTLHHLTFAVIPEAHSPHLNFENNIVTFRCPKSYFINLKDSDEEGFDYVLHGASVSIQKDYKCIGREEKANEGLFPNKKSEDAC